MPFEIAPQVETPAKFADVADTILRGCAMTKPTKGGLCSLRDDGGVTHACVWMAYWVGLNGVGASPMDDTPAFEKARKEYSKRYGNHLVLDYIEGRFTREQIAERVRCL